MSELSSQSNNAVHFLLCVWYQKMPVICMVDDVLMAEMLKLAECEQAYSDSLRLG